MSDNDFTYIDEHEECDDISSDAIDKRVPKVNKDGKKVRGKDIEWRDVKVFADVEEFQESEIKKEIDEEFSEKRNNDWEYGHVYNYVCKFSRRVGFLPCEREMKVVFMSHCSEVHVSDNVVHKHEVDPNYMDTSAGFRWSAEANDVINLMLKTDNHRPKLILRALRDKNIFDGGPEPSMIQLYNKVSHMKKLLRKTEKL